MSMMALTHVPATKPSCTAIVSHAVVLVPTRHSAIMPGAATVALNQGVIPSTIATDSTTN
jgi:hypothetical protein